MRLGCLFRPSLACKQQRSTHEDEDEKEPLVKFSGGSTVSLPSGLAEPLCQSVCPPLQVFTNWATR